MRKDRNKYNDFYKIDMTDEWENSAYDEDGNIVRCDICRSEMRWDPGLRLWYCPGCGQIMDRIQYFNYIGANPPGNECVSNCEENYPFCKRYCEYFSISKDDPMLI